MPLRDSEFVTGAEFGRFRSDMAQWQARLEAQLHTGFDGLNTRLDGLNGRTRRVEEEGARVTERMKILEAAAEDIHEVKEHGCAQLENHREMLSPSPEWWTHRKAAAAGAAGTGVVVGVIELIRVLIQHFSR